jgi:hypothetical protein
MGGLSSPEIDRLRTALEAGRKPKVVFTPAAGQLAGETGQVVDLADPATTDEWLMVRFGHDTLPFSPADLALPPRARAPRTPAPRPARAQTARAASARPVARAEAPAPPAEPVPSPTDSAPPPAAPATGARAARTARAGAARVAADTAPDPGSARGASPATTTQPTAGEAAAEPRARRRPRAPAALTITLSYGDGQWTVAAHQGARVLAKPAPIRAGDALRMVALLDAPAVREAVEQIVAAARAEAEREADRLRAELAAVEARLADLPAAEQRRS